ncbi:MAG: 16S rRNA processing protein RimM, partial [Bdellovibrio sp.]
MTWLFYLIFCERVVIHFSAMRKFSIAYQEKNYVQVGWVSKAHGLKGELYIRLFTPQAEWVNKAQEMLLMKEGKVSLLMPIKTLRLHKKGMIVTSPSLTSRTEAEKWPSAQVFVSEELLISQPGESIFLYEILGFQLISSLNKEPLVVIDFESNGAQDLLVVKNKTEKSFLVPFIEEWIQHID